MHLDYVSRKNRREIEIAFSNGFVKIDLLERTACISPFGGNDVEFVAEDALDSDYQKEIEHFIRTRKYGFDQKKFNELAETCLAIEIARKKAGLRQRSEWHLMKKKKLNAMVASNHACAKNADVRVTVVGWCCSFYKEALEKRLLSLGLEIREVIDYHDEVHVEDCVGTNANVLLLAGLSAFSPQLITGKLSHIAAKIPTCANVVLRAMKVCMKR